MSKSVKFLIEIIAPTLLVMWIAFFTFSALLGRQELAALDQEAAQLTDNASELERRRIVLEKRADLLNPRNLDPDMVDERIRAVLGFVHHDDAVLPRSELDRMRVSSKAMQ